LNIKVSKKDLLFLKKRSKKLLLIWATGRETSWVKSYQSFFVSFLFTKKKTFP